MYLVILQFHIKFLLRFLIDFNNVKQYRLKVFRGQGQINLGALRPK
jgi:hypothetical protein